MSSDLTPDPNLCSMSPSSSDSLSDPDYYPDYNVPPYQTIGKVDDLNQSELDSLRELIREVGSASKGPCEPTDEQIELFYNLLFDGFTSDRLPRPLPQVPSRSLDQDKMEVGNAAIYPAPSHRLDIYIKPIVDFSKHTLSWEYVTAFGEPAILFDVKWLKGLEREEVRRGLVLQRRDDAEIDQNSHIQHSSRHRPCSTSHSLLG
jgi:hypothetical protein